MKKIILFFLIALTSCSAPKSTLTGKYQDTPYQIETSKSLDETWSAIIDLFATKGLSIKIIDKSSGLITSNKTSFLFSYTYENKQGQPEDPNAFVVVNKLKGGFGNTLNPQVLTGEWNIRIKEVNSKTVINVNLVNIIAQYTAPRTTTYTAEHTYNLVAKSTGVFEKLIADQIK